LDIPGKNVRDQKPGWPTPAIKNKAMEAIRQILDVKNNSLIISLPDGFKATKVEVIVLPVEEKPKSPSIAGLRGKLKLSGAQYKDFQNDVKDSREGWEKNI